MSDLVPEFIRADASASEAVEAELRCLLAEITEATATCCEEEVDPGTFMPILTPDMVHDWLTTNVNSLEQGRVNTTYRRQIAIAIQRVSVEFLEATLQMDSAMEALLQGSGSTVSTAVLHVNIPEVIEYLQERPKTPGKVHLVLIPDFYDEAPQQDGRTDVLLGVTMWRGEYLCRPALVSLDKLHEHMKKTALNLATIKDATVQYEPQYGYH